MTGRVLIVAGSDSGGGAGIQADIKTVTALNGYAATAITALTAQDTNGVHGIHAIPPAFIQQQMRVVIGDIGVDCVKTGMLHNSDVINAVMDVLDRDAQDVPVVVDPVMVAKGGAKLLDPLAVATLKDRLLHRATILTPNAPEAQELTGMTIVDDAGALEAGRLLMDAGGGAVLMKGGHLAGPDVHDLLVTADGSETFSAPRSDTRHTHGTGCTLASAIATGIAQDMPLREAVARALAYVQKAIREAPGFGGGQGPIGHTHTVRPFSAD